MPQEEAPDYTTIEFVMRGSVAGIMLNRPKIRNAFNEEMIAELNDLFKRLVEWDDHRVVVLTGQGSAFCAGADLHWMKKMIDYGYEENLDDALALAELMHRIYTHPRPTLARVNGPAIGGGTGLVAACDIAIASEAAVFSLSEVRIGLVPACIAPYVIKRLGESRARELFLTGERFSAQRAAELGFVNLAVGERQLDDAVDDKIDSLLLRSGPEALKVCKQLVENVPAMSLEEARRYTADTIARLRVSEEGQEGMNAFLNKRLPAWASESRSK